MFLDVEGFECRALEGAARTFEANPDWFVEVHVGCGLEAAGGSVDDILSSFPSNVFERFVHAENDNECIPFERAPQGMLKTRFFPDSDCPHTGKSFEHMTVHWAILTGEYPPQTGGVADYTRQVALALAAAGDRVDVFAPPGDTRTEIDNPGINVHRLPDHFGPHGLAALDRTLGRIKADRLLIQYVPHAYGWKAMNLPFAIWVATSACTRPRTCTWVMFHEVAFPFHWRPLTHALLSVVTRTMARLIAGAAERVFSSIASWGREIRRFCPRAKPVRVAADSQQRPLRSRHNGDPIFIPR